MNKRNAYRQVNGPKLTINAISYIDYLNHNFNCLYTGHIHLYGLLLRGVIKHLSNDLLRPGQPKPEGKYRGCEHLKSTDILLAKKGIICSLPGFTGILRICRYVIKRL